MLAVPPLGLPGSRSLSMIAGTSLVTVFFTDSRFTFTAVATSGRIVFYTLIMPGGFDGRCHRSSNLLGRLNFLLLRTPHANFLRFLRVSES